MGTIVVTEFVSLDGVMEDPGGAEDFKYGGWTFEIARGDEAFERLQTLKSRFDPNNVLRRNQNIAPLPGAGGKEEHHG